MCCGNENRRQRVFFVCECREVRSDRDDRNYHHHGHHHHNHHNHGCGCNRRNESRNRCSECNRRF